MAEIIKTAALAVSVCVLCAVIKQYRPEYAPIVQIAAVAVIAASAGRILQNIISQLDFFSGMSETGGECISVLIKALGVAVAAIFSSVIYALVPKGNMQKIMRCVTALTVICALVFPLASALMKTNFSASSPDTEALIPSELNNEVNYRLTAAYAQQMQDGVQEILASYGYPDCEIDLLTDIDEYGGIFIKKANIILPSGAVLKEAAVEKLQNLLGDAVIDIRTGSTS